MEQSRALNALEPFLALSKTATSPRAAAELVTQATSAPNTFFFSELLYTPHIQALASSDFSKHHTLLQIFSYGTYQDFMSTLDLPTLNDAQTLKLRQLSLLTLARDPTNLSYDAIRQSLSFNTNVEVENLVISAVYSGLLAATLDQRRQAVQVTSFAPLRDITPNAVPEMLTALTTWADRCTSTLGDLETQMQDIRAAAATREKVRTAAAEILTRAITELRDDDKKHGKDTYGGGGGGSSTKGGTPGAKGTQKARRGKAEDDAEHMDLDEEQPPEEERKRAGKRKL